MKNNLYLYDQVDSLLQELSSPGIHPGLERVSRLVDLLGHPESAFPAVHVVGSNGKGSTSSMIASILVESGYKTALYTSPHLVHFGERLTINGEAISPQIWIDEIKRLFRIASEDTILSSDMPTYFEAMTAVSFSLIAKNGVDVAVVEAGMGGRLDATNLLENVVLSVITPLAMDHSDYLGDTIEKIAMEKFAVIRTGGTALYYGDKNGPLSDLFKKICHQAGARGEILDQTLFMDSISISLEGTDFCVKTGSKLNCLKTSLIGKYQARNGSLAYRASRLLSRRFFKINDDSISEGLKKCNWPGRFQVIRREPLTIVDGAHNPHGMMALVETASDLLKDKKTGVVFTSMADKDYRSVLRILSDGLKCSIYCTGIPGNSRCETPERLERTAKEYIWTSEPEKFMDPLEAITKANKECDAVLCCGSLYLVAYLARLRHERS